MTTKHSYFEMSRAGEFAIDTKGNFHCGTESHQPMKYSLVVKCSGGSLDSRGFLFDQVGVQKYFDAKKSVSISCERWAEESTAALFTAIRRENPGAEVESMALTLSPHPYQASITYGWRREDEPEPERVYV